MINHKKNNDVKIDLFSPSNVKKRVEEILNPLDAEIGVDINTNDLASEITQVPLLLHTISSIIEGIRPIVGTAGTLASQVVYFAGKQATEKAVECLVGHSINDFQNAISLNHQLLTELSYTKAE